MIFQLAIIGILVFLLFMLDRKPKNYPPGPWGIPVLGSFQHFNCLSTNKLMKFYEKYGKVFSIRFGSRMVVFMADHDIVKTTLSKAESAERPKFFTFSILAFFKNIGLVNSNGDQWALGRRFALRQLRDLGLGKSRIQASVQTETSHLIRHFKNNTGEPTEITYELNVAILNIVWQLIADKRYPVDDEKMNRFTYLIEETFDFIQGPGMILNLYPQLQYITPTFLQNKMFGVDRFKSSRLELAAFFKEVITEHADSLDVDNPRDFIDHYLIEMKKEIKNTNSGHTLDYADLETTIFDLFAAGSETTSSSLRWMAMLLTLHPEEQRKAQKLIDEVVPRSRLPSLEDRENMVYIEAMIYEMLRFSSLGTFGGIPHSAGSDMNIGGYKVPKGSVLLTCSEIIQKSPLYYEKPDEFYPGHFIGKNGELLTKREGFMPFSLGRRSCLGESLAKAELFLLITGLVQNFNLKSDLNNPMKIELDPARPLFNLLKPFKVVFEERGSE